MKYPSLLITCLSLLLVNQLPANEHEHEHEQHAAHVHGEALLLVAVDGNAVEIELHSPAMNIIGFEHRPASEQQHKQLDAAIGILQDGDKLFSLPAAAHCTMEKAQVEAPYKNHGWHHEHEQAETHSEFSATYRYSCQKPALLKQLMVKLFEHFPMTEHIEAQSISARGQQAAELDSNNFILEL